jgi:2-methylcitrate dehydratase PrpD
MTHVHCAWEYKAQGVTAAQMNLFYGLAVIALDGVAFTDQYREERLRDPRILDFIGRVTARVDPEIEGMGAAFRHAARVKVTTRDGRSLEKMPLHRRGSPEAPLEPGDIEYKFRHVVKSCLAPADIDRVVALTGRLEQLDTTRELIDIAARPVMGDG